MESNNPKVIENSEGKTQLHQCEQRIICNTHRPRLDWPSFISPGKIEIATQSEGNFVSTEMVNIKLLSATSGRVLNNLILLL